MGWRCCSLRSFRCGKKGVSPVLGTVIMVLIVVIGMSAVFAFFVDYVGDYQQGQGSSVMEMVEIEDVFFVDSTNTSEVWLYNFGEIEFEVNAVYVNGLNATLEFMDVSSKPLNDLDGDYSVEVGPFVHAKFSVTVADNWVPDATYVFKFVTERGSAVEREYVVS